MYGEKRVPFDLVVPGYGTVKGACVNNWFVSFSRCSKDFDLNKSWNEYKSGFGTIPDNFLIGNEAGHNIFKTAKYTGRIEARTKGQIIQYII